jgi:hypothetical protein
MGMTGTGEPDGVSTRRVTSCSIDRSNNNPPVKAAVPSRIEGMGGHSCVARIRLLATSNPLSKMSSPNAKRVPASWPLISDAIEAIVG